MMDSAETARVDWKRSYYAEAEQSDALRKECDALRKDAKLGRFVRRHMREIEGGWRIDGVSIPGAPSLEDITDALCD